jgi:hypothetical protein
MNENQRRVILYGDSLILAGVRASLETCPDLQILLLDPSQDKPLEAIRACCPATFIFDLGAVQPDFQLSLLQQPGLLLIGVSPESDRMMLWSGRQLRQASTQDLVQAIQHKESSSESFERSEK